MFVSVQAYPVDKDMHAHKKHKDNAHVHSHISNPHKQLNSDLCSVLKIAKMCFVDIKPFSTSLIFRLSRGSMYFFSFS